MSRVRRETTAPDIAAKILFWSDRTCCVCRERGKPVQIHHVDGDHTNDEINNLAVLCLACHTETQIRGGFHRKLDGDQVVLYRMDWYSIVARERTAAMQREGPPAQEASNPRIIASIIENLKEAKEFALLAMQYERIGANDLRDKYIELALSNRVEDSEIIFLRAMQGRRDLIPRDAIYREVKRLEKCKDWLQLARLYKDVGDHRQAALFYCKGVIPSIEANRIFTAAYYLKELCKEGIVEALFEQSYRAFAEEGDLWWEIRSLQELGWQGQIDELVKSRSAEVEASGNPALLRLLYEATGDRTKMEEAQIAFVSGMRTVRGGAVRSKNSARQRKKKMST
jgi:hypothetical protein